MSDGKVEIVVRVPESAMPESPRPWFEVERNGKAWRGQATAPPEPQPDGSLVYHVAVHPHDPSA